MKNWTRWAWTMLGLCSAFTFSWAAAAAPPHATASQQPDVLVLVFTVPGGPDQVGLTYPGLVPHAQVIRDVHAIQTATGWNVSGVHIADLPPPIKKSKQKMTGVDFVVPSAVNPQARYLPIEPFVNSLRSYHHVTVTYLVGSEFGFEGLRHYADNHVKVALDQHGSTYTYQIFYHDGRFGHLNLPRYQLANTSGQVAQAAPSSRRVNPWLIALVAVAAVGAGCIVYAVFTRSA